MSELEIYKGMVKKMKDDEIKEILDYLKDYTSNIPSYVNYGIEIPKKDILALLDYITNLQQKVEYYEGFEINKTIDKIRLQNNREYKEVMTQLEDYKSRNEKAIAFVDEFIQKNYYEKLDEYITHFTWNTTKEDLLNILQRKSDE